MDDRKKNQELEEGEDQRIFTDELPDLYLDDTGFRSVLMLKINMDYIMQRIPEGFITRELLIKLADIESVSSDLTSIRSEELEELDNLTDDEEMMKAIESKTIRELYYELIIEKNFHRISQAQGIDELSDVKVKWEKFDEKNDGTERVPRKKRGSIMDSDDDDFDIYRKEDHVAFIADVVVTPAHLLGDDVDCPEPIIEDRIGCKSLKTILEETHFKEEGRLHALHSVVCLFSYDNRELGDKEMPIEQEITEAVNNLNHNTLKPHKEMYSQIKGCVIVSNGLGILILEISMFDLIRMLNSVNWSRFRQNVNTVRILSSVPYITSRFPFFITCRAFFNENDTRKFPDPKQFAKKFEKNDRKYLSKVQYYLEEISDKITYTISLLMHQANNHPCGIAELPRCASDHLPSVQLLKWAFKIPYLKTWTELSDEIMKPEPYYDHTEDSYPAPTDMFNLRNLYIMDEFKEYLPLFYRKGFRPQFSESVLPPVIVPEVCRPEAEDVFTSESVLYVENEDAERNFSRL